MRQHLQVVMWFVALSSIPLLSSCQTDPTQGSTLVEGQVLDRVSRQPIGWATMQVYHASKGGGYAPVGQNYGSDTQGRFSFCFEAESATGYLLKATAPPGYVTDWGEAPELTAGHPNKGVIVPVLAPAFVRVIS